eukprot:m.14846 g.14846  ORF g.14846 m.14846 type:complete len:119 (-) comp2980_c0_seq1:138-494(-)
MTEPVSIVPLDLHAHITTATPIGANVIAGTPLSGSLPAYENHERGVSVGQWACEPGAWTFTANEDEVCIILSGRGRLIWNDNKTVFEFGGGMSFVIPRGFKGTWETIEKIRKIYVVVE